MLLPPSPTDGAVHRRDLLTVLVARSLRSRSGQGWIPVRLLSWACEWLCFLWLSLLNLSVLSVAVLFDEPHLN